MSYNISGWKTRDLTNLKIPFSAICQKEVMGRYKLQAVIEEITSDGILIAISDEYGSFELEGLLRHHEKSDMIEVSEIDLSSDGSGYFYEDVLKPALTKSTGSLVARIVWEGGDSVENLVVLDGKIKVTDL